MNNQFFDNKVDVKNWLDKMGVKDYTINPDLTVDVSGFVDLSEKNLTFLPIQFNRILTNQGNFHIDNNQLTSLLGSPREVVGTFNCQNNVLKNLDYVPQKMSRIFCGNNPIQIEHSFETKLECFYHNCVNEKDRIQLFKDLYKYDKYTKKYELELWEYFFCQKMDELKQKEKIIVEAKKLNVVIQNDIPMSHNKLKL